MARTTVEEAIRAFAEGRLVIVIDDAERENEGDLCLAAERVTPEVVNFMARHGRGLICVALTARRLAELGLPQMVEENTALLGTAFTVSVDARHGVTTGISAFDRARTIQLLVAPGTRPEDLARPGHVFPLRAEPGGVLARPGHTEAAIDLARLARLRPAAVICEIMDEDGTMACRPRLEALARDHGLPMLSIADLVAYRRRQDPAVLRTATTRLPTRWATFQAHLYRELGHPEAPQDHLALALGGLDEGTPLLVRLHSECLTGDALGSVRCDCGRQLKRSLSAIAGEGRGLLVYLRQEGRGIGLFHKLRAYELQDGGVDTVEANHQLGLPADLREYGVAARILEDLGVSRVRLLTNNPAKASGLREHGIEVVEEIPLRVPVHEETAHYLEAKRSKLGHRL